MCEHKDESVRACSHVKSEGPGFEPSRCIMIFRFQISNEILLGIFCIQHNTNENTVKENDLLWTIKEKSWQTGPHNKA